MNETQARQVVYARSGGTCELCRAGKAASWAHRAPRSHGGLWTPSNGLHLCGGGTTGCHGHTESHREEAYVGGWLIRTGGHPVDVPVWLQGVAYPTGWLLLDDDGCVRVVDPVVYGLPEVPELPPWALRHGARF